MKTAESNTTQPVHTSSPTDATIRESTPTVIERYEMVGDVISKNNGTIPSREYKRLHEQFDTLCYNT